MKNLTKSMLFVATAVTVALFGCKKEENITPASNPSTNNGNVSNIASFLSRKQSPKQTFSVNANIQQRIVGSKGTILDISPYSFKTLSGQVVTGNVTVELREMYSKSDMIFSKAPTMSSNGLLVSGGELFLQAFQNGAQLQLNGTDKIKSKFPSTGNYKPMAEFYNNNTFDNNTSSTYAGVSENSPFTWYGLDSTYVDSTYTDSTSWVNYDYDSTYNSPYYSFYLDGMNWINCDYFWDNAGPFTDMSINAGTQFDASNCVIYVSVDGIQSVMELYDFDLNHVFDAGYANIPVGLNVHIVAVANINGQFYSAIVPATTTANFTENITLVATTEAQLTAAINALP